MDLFCPSCNSNNIIRLGEIPSGNLFAGRTLDYSLPGGCLYRCKVCHLYFRWPRLSKRKLDELYKEADPNNWQYKPTHRKDWKLAATWLNSKLVQGKILDIGCWDGKFLDYLGKNWQGFGVEINEVALQKAKERGITILEKNFNELHKISVYFDVVVAFDVIEHTENPMFFLEQMARLTRTNGFIIISSGNTDALTWKISGSKYWYCAIPEHISFINVNWCYFAATKLNLKVEYVERFSHAGKRNLAQFLLDTIENATYLASPSLFRKLRKIKNIYLCPKNINNMNYPPPWGTSKDHLIIFFSKNKPLGKFFR